MAHLWKNGRFLHEKKITVKKSFLMWQIPSITRLQNGTWTKKTLSVWESGIPGPVNNKGEVDRAVNLYWGFKAVSKELSELTGLPSKAGNDANVAALGEAWKGAAEGAQNVMMVTLGTGVGGGIIVDGKIIAGQHGAGGEIGHALVVRGEKEKCNCGNRGCLEQYASATGIVRVAGRMLCQLQRRTACSEVWTTSQLRLFWMLSKTETKWQYRLRSM